VSEHVVVEVSMLRSETGSNHKNKHPSLQTKSNTLVNKEGGNTTCRPKERRESNSVELTIHHLSQH